MEASRLKRSWIVLGYILAVFVLAVGLWRYGYIHALDQLARRAEADLALASDRLDTQLKVYQELAVLMSDHPMIGAAGSNEDIAALNAVLLEVADKTSALDVAYADARGNVLATAHAMTPENLADTRYFTRAMQGALGSDHGIRTPLTRRAYFHAAPVFAPSGQVIGAVIVVADVERIERFWPGRTPAVFFTDRNDEVFFTNRSELLFWTRPSDGTGLVPSVGEPRAFSASMVGAHDIWSLDWGPYLPRKALHLQRDMPVIGLTGEILVDAVPAQRLALLQAAAVAAICLAFGAWLYLLTERRQALAEANVALESRVQERTRALSETNTRLLREVAEREEAEAALKQAQDDLVQAGKLSALGQMSAGISHELNQPLMAIRSFAENATQYLERGRSEQAAENLGRISDLARRMGRIIRNLRAFARQESEAAARVDLVAVLNSAIELTETRLQRGGVALRFDPPDRPIWVRGGEVRLGQVFVNLITNAADAMDGQDRREVRIEVSASGPVTVRVSDTGPGLDMPDKVFDPFYTTKTVGASEGMGLGLSISYGIVQSFGGDIRGENAPDGGAIFTVLLEPWQQEQAA